MLLKKSSLKFVGQLFVIIALLIIIFLLYSSEDKQLSEMTDTSPVNTIDYSPSTEADNEISEKAKVSGTIDDPINDNSDFEAIVTNTSYDQQNQTFSVGIQANANDDGMCSLEITDSINTVSASETTLRGNGTIGCSVTFSIDKLNIDSDWLITGTVEANGRISNQINYTISPEDR